MVAVRKAVAQQAICGLLPITDWWIALPEISLLSSMFPSYCTSDFSARVDSDSFPSTTAANLSSESIHKQPCFLSYPTSCTFCSTPKNCPPNMLHEIEPRRERGSPAGPLEFYHPRWRRPLGWSPWGEWQGRCAGHCRLSSAECSKPRCETLLLHWWSVKGGIAWRFAQYIYSKKEKEHKDLTVLYRSWVAQ